MNPLNALRALVMAGVGLAAALVLSVYAASAQTAVTKASDWLGHAVVTRDGKDLGTVRDVAIDQRSGKVVYLVVSVGSFLIENNLIAVAPDALVAAPGDDSRLFLEADAEALRNAKRFASDAQWPTRPDVTRSPGSSVATVPAETPAGEAPAAAAPTSGTATIESRSKTAHLSANERVITAMPVPPAATPPKAAQASSASSASASRLPPITPFDKLDKDGDGVLNRSEFAHQMSPKDSYSKIDTNANGVIDSDEFDAFEDAHGGAN